MAARALREPQNPVAMFALPPIVLLLFFLYVRPQEYYTQLTVVPWLHLLFGLSVLGHLLDIKLSLVRPKPTPHLPWTVAFLIWALIATGIRSSGTVMGSAVEIVLFLMVGYLIGNALTTLRALNVIAVVVTTLAMILAMMTIYQARQPKECMKSSMGSEIDHTGTPDGRPCQRSGDCSILEPGAKYLCEHVGLMGTNSVYGRARYRGILKDPNDLSLTLAIALPLLIALMRQRPNRRRILLTVFSSLTVFASIIPTQSRGGQLVFMAVMGMHFLFHFGLKISMIAGAPALPLLAVMVLLKSRRADADASSEERIRCQWNALRMFGEYPLTGVGYGRITDHWKQTAHNAYLLAPAELGVPGTIIWYVHSYLSFKILIKAREATKNKPEARVAFFWAEAILASQVGLHIGITFLSFCYHFVYWIYLGLSGAVYKAVQSHDPDFEVKFTGKDAGILGVIGTAWLSFWKVFIELKYRKL